MAQKIEVAGRLVSKGESKIPSHVVGTEGQRVEFSRLFVVSLAYTRYLKEREDAISAAGGRNSKKGFPGIKAEIGKLDGPIDRGLEEVSLEGKFLPVGSKDKMSVLLTGLNALVLELLVPLGSRLELEGAMENGVLRVTGIVVLQEADGDLAEMPTEESLEEESAEGPGDEQPTGQTAGEDLSAGESGSEPGEVPAEVGTTTP